MDLKSPLTARLAAAASDASTSRRQPQSQQHRHVEEDNPFMVASSSSKSSRTPRTPQTHHSQNTSMERVPTPTFMDEDNNPFMPSHKPASTPSRKQVSAIPQVVNYHELSSKDQEMFSSEYPHRATPPTRRHAYSPAQPSLMSPTSTRHVHHPIVEAVPAPQFTPKAKHSGSSKDSELIRAKKELKKWEAEFRTTHGRDATQDDIAENPLMVRKYRDYGKLKKAQASKSSKTPTLERSDMSKSKSRSSSSAHSLTSTRSSDVLRTPTKHSRTHHFTEAELLRTPSRKKEVEYISPRKITNPAGFMSPSRNNQADMERHQFLTSIASPTTQRTRDLLMSPSRDSGARSLLKSPLFGSPSSRSLPSLAGFTSKLGSEYPGSPSGRKTPRASLANNVLRSPTQSPLFGGMNNRRKKVSKRPPVPEDLEPVQEIDEPNLTTLSTWEENQSTASMSDQSPLLKTPQKSGAAKAARSLFRRPSNPLNLFGTPPPYSSPKMTETAFPNSNMTPPRRGSSPTRKTSHSSVQDALDSMTLNDRGASLDFQDHTDFMLEDNDQWVDEDNDAANVEHSPIVSQEEFPSPGYHSDLLKSPSRSQRSVEPPRTPSQQPSLTFSQTTPGSARSEPDLLVVPPGFHSLYRRRQARSSFFMASQEDDAKFEREYNVGSQDMTNIMGFDDIDTNTRAVQEPAHVSDDDGSDDNKEGNASSLWDVAKVPKKKYTQKRSTRLHRIAVAPSEKTKPAKATRTSSRNSKEDNETLNKKEADIADTEAAKTTDLQAPDDNTLKAQELDPKSIAKGPSTASESLSSGWANSNKPLVRSDRRQPGVGQGRAGAKRSTASYGSGGSGGNFVAYNLQRGSFKKRGRGGSRFAGSRFGNPVTAPSGRSLFDNDSWRTDFDKDFDDNALVMSFADNGLDMLVDEDDGLPWYGNVNDATDPCIVAISKKYLQRTVGEANDPEEFIKELELQQIPDDNTENGSNGFKVNLQYVLQRIWGHQAFRDGQLDSVKRILRYESSLLVLPTGSGKSLSYQLPAYVLSKLGIPSLTLVISPMISLMYDQVKQLPPGLTGACWTSVEQTTAQFKDFMEKLRNNTIKILFISPEKLQSQSFLSLVKSKQIPRISFLCVDEVHCLSEWSHNFRPAYLLLNHVLKTELKSPCVLGLTGTATEGTKDSICSMLDIDRLTGVLSGAVIRDNLAMTVSLESERDTALLHLLQSPKFAAMDSILIYVMKQVQADALAAFLRVRNFSAESYHAGKSTQDRQRIQERFMNTNAHRGGTTTGGGGIRILCATIAFGLGLNKSNIRSVIHYSMPKSLENYIQEIGRSGRDGLPSYCHMFLSQTDYLSLRSLAYANGMDLGSLLRLIKKLFSRKSLLAAGNDASTSTAGSTKKRPNGSRKNSVDESSELPCREDAEDGRDPKKRRQNNSRAVPVKGSKAKVDPVHLYEQQRRDLVTSCNSILVIPPPPATLGRTVVATASGLSSNSKRLVVVREELIEQEFDIKKEVLATLLSYIELDRSRPIKVIGSVSSKCTVKFLKDGEELAELANHAPLMDMIMTHGVMTGHNSNGRGRKGGYGGKTGLGLGGSTLSNAYCCDSMSLCQQAGMSYTELVQDLQLWKRKKWVVFELTDPGLCVEILQEPAVCMAEQKQQQRATRYTKTARHIKLRASAMDVDQGNESELSENSDSAEDDHDKFVQQLGERLYRKLCAVERVGVAKVDHVYELFHKVATPTWQQQKAFTAHLQGIDNEDNMRDQDQDRFEEDEDQEVLDDIEGFIVVKSSSRSSRAGSKVTEAELVLREGIQEYFARSSGEGIGGPSAADDLFEKSAGPEQPANINDKMMLLYQYESPVVTDMQRQWRSAVEVDLKVFLAQQWQQYQQQQQSLSSSSGKSFGPKPIDSPRVVSRIFHGIHSPCYPVMEWCRDKYWGRYVHFDFGAMMQMADRILKEQRQLRARNQHKDKDVSE
ncbi:hypothetical protein MVEG_06040 [Podila verticillata NRRL 6337]|nr:hypothetical protein MVEG_06040 [Podila verticillata NRRL 6337]